MKKYILRNSKIILERQINLSRKSKDLIQQVCYNCYKWRYKNDTTTSRICYARKKTYPLI